MQLGDTVYTHSENRGQVAIFVWTILEFLSMLKWEKSKNIQGIEGIKEQMNQNLYLILIFNTHTVDMGTPLLALKEFPINAMIISMMSSVKETPLNTDRWLM